MTTTHPVAPPSDLLGPGETFTVESSSGCDGGCGGGCGAGCGGGCGGGCAGAHADVDTQPHTDTQADPVMRLHIDDSLFAAWTSNQFSASSDWLPAAPVKRVRARWELRDLVGPFRAAPGFQVANRETAPGAFNNIGTQQTTEGVRQTEWEDLSSYVDDKVLIRFGWVTRNSTGTALSFGHARGVFEVELHCGSVLQFEVPFSERFPPGELVFPQGVEWPSVGEVADEAEWAAMEHYEPIGYTSERDRCDGGCSLDEEDDSSGYSPKASPRLSPWGDNVALSGLAGAAAWGRMGSAQKGSASEGGTRRDEDDVGDDPFEMPPRGEWGSPNSGDCALKDRRDNCDAPIVGPYRSIDDLLTDELREEVLRRVTITGETGEEEDFLIAAWALLIANVDVIDWLSCLMMSRRRQQCLSRVVSTRWTRNVKIRLLSEAHKFCEAGLKFGERRNNIYICRNSTSNTWESYLSLWQGGPGSQSRECGVIDLAATLLHELTHACGQDEPGPNSCGVSYRIENSFRWAMAFRYFGAGRHPCCGGRPGNWRKTASGEDSAGLGPLWNYDGSIFPTDDDYCPGA
ncbi:hypothetical protein L6R49_24190 [Myxococcota bacterium]|nr:hypothetical protein [Myxococcota bacterium]